MGETSGEATQGMLGGLGALGKKAPTEKVSTVVEAASRLPFARVALELSLPHLDQPFDYLVPAAMDGDAVPGVRVVVRFAGQRVGGYLLERRSESEFSGVMAPLLRVVSPEPALSPEVAAHARAVADRYAGTLADVLRLAVPPRHATVEKEPIVLGEPPAVRPPEAPRWERYAHGAALLTALADGRAPRAVWQPLPGEQWPARLAEVVAATLASGRGALVVLPDARDCARVDEALTAQLGEGAHVVLTASLGPAERYRRWLRARRGQVRCVVGTRGAALAHVERLGLVVIWDDGDDLHAEPRAPYPHARELLLTRAQLTGAGALVAGFARTPEAQLLVDTSWGAPVIAARELLRATAPRVVAVDESATARDGAAAQARLPTVAWSAARDALAAGAPVLVQVPRRGYLPSVACATCRKAARCAHCAGPLALGAASGTPACRWCGRPAADWACGACGGRRLRASVVGAARTAEELGRAFPGTPIYTSGRGSILESVGEGPALVVATPGAEPVPASSYGAALLLDPWAFLTRADLRAGQEALRRWMAAAALVRPASEGGRVVVTADPELAVVQALIRWDPAGFAARELGERAQMGFPPAVRMASVEASPEALEEYLAQIVLPDGVEILGPVPTEDESVERVLFRAARRLTAPLAAALAQTAALRSARKAPGVVRLHLDPTEL